MASVYHPDRWQEEKNLARKKNNSITSCARSVSQNAKNLNDDHLANGHHDGVVNLDVSLLDLDAVDGAVGDGEGVARDGGELGAVRHVGEAVGALDDVGAHDLGNAVVGQ